MRLLSDRRLSAKSNRMFHEDVQAEVYPMVLQCANHFQAGPVTHMRQPRIPMTTEVPLQDLAIGGPIEDRTPCFQLTDTCWRLLACNSAIRQLFRYWPPRIVSAKWTRQLSLSSTSASAAAIPPSAITVCALPSKDFEITATLAPAAEAPPPPAGPRPGSNNQNIVLMREVFGH